MSSNSSSLRFGDDNDTQPADLKTEDVHVSTSNILRDNPTPIAAKTESNDNAPTTKSLVLAVLAAVSGTAFHFGYASGVVNSPQNYIEEFINETTHRRNSQSNISEDTLVWIFSVIVSIFALGGMIGGLFGGFITDRFGRKGGMFLNNIISIIACVLMMISKPSHSYELLIVGRFAIGLACGYGSSVAPTYINEISPKHLRGTFGASFQLGVVVFLFFAQIITLDSILGSATTWHYAFGLPIVLSVLQIVLLFLVPESPKFLLLKKKNEVDAEKALRWLRGHANVHHEIAEMQEEENQQQHSASIGDLFRTPTVRWALLITVVLQLSQQFSGINAIFYYSTAIFKQANYSPSTSQYINLGLGATNIVITIVSVFLMDRLGRRILHMTGLGGMLFTTTLLVISLLVKSTPSWNQLSIAMTVLFVAFFGVGPGSIPWLITAELFGQAFRVPASSIAVLVNWSANFMIGIGFKPLFQSGLGVNTFFIFVVLLILFLLFTFFFVPETKAKNVETIYAEINAGQVWRRRRVTLIHSDNQGGQINTYGSTVGYDALPTA